MEYDNNIPIYLQVINRIKKDMIQGKLPMGEKLPSTRELAVQYHINPNTAMRIYKEMELQHMCFTKRGLGTFVTEDPAVITQMRVSMAGELLNGFVREMKELGFSKEELLDGILARFDKAEPDEERQED
ncbi:MAG: GntR family transcriptional regulator [Roseburia sp.]|nr:GntR family transcriptional regulator [Roseburia sp.]